MSKVLQPCKQKKFDCFACREGKCNALSDTNFDKPCPFYKKKKERK